jgi:superfamily I DNA and/or RNA helicase
LRQHFRSHPDIIGFSNREIYGGQLVVRTPAERLLSGRAFEWRDCAGSWERNSAGRSLRKPDEAEAVLDELERQWMELRPLARTIGVVTPFRAQVDLLRDRIGERLPDFVGNVTIDTAFGFQGDERDVMIFTVAISPDLPAFSMRFAGDRHLVNVAVTRARSRLIILGDHAAALASGTLLALLAQYAVDLGSVGV